MTEDLEVSGLAPSVTILMASYGRLELLKRSVNSALGQQYPNFRVMIVDDGSSDDVVEWLKSLESKEPKISVIFQEHRGVAAARAKGVAESETDLICILDSDDVLVPAAVATLVDAMGRHSGIELVFADIREVRANGESALHPYRQFDSTRSMILATLVRPRVPFKHSGTLFRRQTALALGSYDINLPCKVDIDLYLKFMSAGYLPEHVEQPLVDFRMHKNSLSLDRLTGIRVWLYLIDRYGPANPAYRLLIKSARVGAELLKRIYVEFRG